MADTTGQLEAKLAKINKSLDAQSKKLETAILLIARVQNKSNDAETLIQNGFSGETATKTEKCREIFGKANIKKADALKLSAKFKEDVDKAVEIEGRLKVEVSGLFRQKEAAEKALKTYKEEKKRLADSLKTGGMDKKEYERRKQMLKTSLADLTTLSEKKLAGLKKTQKEKMAQLEKLIDAVEKKTVAWSKANDFLAAKFTSSASVTSPECQKLFGKKTITKADAQKAVKKLKDDMDKTVKDHDKLAAETAAVGSQVDEINKRLKEIENDIARDRRAFQDGNITEKQFLVKCALWKKSVALE